MRIVFLPGFDGDATLRGELFDALARDHEVRAVSYPRHALGTLEAYRHHAVAMMPVDWRPVIVAESFSGLVAARWAAVDARVQALVLCAAFARNPLGATTRFGASWPSLAKLGALFTAPSALLSGDPARRRWSAALSRTLMALPNEVVTERLRLIADEDVSASLGGLRIPVALLQFQHDLVIGAAARDHLEAVCHNAHVLRLPGPHFALETRPAECAQAIDRYLRTLPPR